MAGRFTGFGRATNVVEFAGDGVGSWSAIGATTGGPAYLVPAGFKWRVEGDVLFFQQNGGWQSPFVCASGTVSRYRMRFDDDCSAVHLVALEDPCIDRKKQLDGSTGIRKRQP